MPHHTLPLSILPTEQLHRGYQDFSEFQKEIQSIVLKPVVDFESLRDFCTEYGGRVLEIHQRYFLHHEKDFNIFEKRAREEIEKQCIEVWSKQLGASPSPINESLEYLGHKQWWRRSGKQGYELRIAQTNTILKGHSFDCYAELLHNGSVVAKAFGEAKNYDLIAEHFETLQSWLKDVSFHPERGIPDLAYFFAPGCPPLLRMKIENVGIKTVFLDREKDTQPREDQENISSDPKKNTDSQGKRGETENPPNGVDINSASFERLCAAFKGSRIRQTTIDKLIERRKSKKYVDMGELAADLSLTSRATGWLTKKFQTGDIYFSNANF